MRKLEFLGFSLGYINIRETLIHDCVMKAKRSNLSPKHLTFARVQLRTTVARKAITTTISKKPKNIYVVL